MNHDNNNEHNQQSFPWLLWLLLLPFSAWILSLIIFDVLPQFYSECVTGKYVPKNAFCGFSGGMFGVDYPVDLLLGIIVIFLGTNFFLLIYGTMPCMLKLRFIPLSEYNFCCYAFIFLFNFTSVKVFFYYVIWSKFNLGFLSVVGVFHCLAVHMLLLYFFYLLMNTWYSRMKFRYKMALLISIMCLAKWLLWISIFVYVFFFTYAFFSPWAFCLKWSKYSAKCIIWVLVVWVCSELSDFSSSFLEDSYKKN